jgi:tetratricopeptide (TPR) repeat protein
MKITMISKIRAFVIATALTSATAGLAQLDSQRAVLPLTTKSPKVYRLLDQAWVLAIDKVEQVNAIGVLREVVKADPGFALGHELLAESSLDPAEQVSEQKKASETRSQASPGEQMVIEWFQNAADNNLLTAIAKMNDVLSLYPHDKWVVYLATKWLVAQAQYERAAIVYERSGISDSPGLMNETAYAYAYMRQFDKAFALMDKYLAALPHDANPQDSYAEILRMAGHFDQAVEHYRAALTINPDFYSSQFGIADTYSLMGDQVRARYEYKTAFQKFHLPELHRLQWQTCEAITYVRDGDLNRADKAFQAIADHAHTRHESQAEADTYRQMAMYQRNPKKALLFLSKAEASIREGKNGTQTALQQEFAKILRVRVELALRMSDKKTAHVALTHLAALAQNGDDKLIEAAYRAAAGASLVSEAKYEEAISNLIDDINNPLSLELLSLAYQKMGDSANAKSTNETLANLNDPTLEQALIVPAFRKCYQDPFCTSGLKNVSLAH